jgi:serine/threonine protein phosphatase 1
MSNWSTLPGAPVEEQIFAIGDIHGQAATLEKALARISNAPRNGKPSHLIFLGDLTDRGPENLKAVDLAMNGASLAAVDKVTILAGNHELMLMDAMRNAGWGMRMWAKNGGFSVLDEIDPDHKFNSVDEAAALLKEKFGDFIDLIDKSPNHLRIADLLFVHAGISPTDDLDEFLSQPRFGETKFKDHWAWIREPFVEHVGTWAGQDGLVVVHGHTSQNDRRKINPAEASDYLDRVEVSRRICLDAGAAGMGQAALLEVNNAKYKIDIVQEIEWNPALDDDADASWWENEASM